MTRRPAAIARGIALGLGLALLLGACAGGSGSSGFGSALQAENAAIDAALDARGCAAVDGDSALTVCAADGGAVTPGGTPGPTPGTGQGTVDTNLDGSEDVACSVALPAGGCTVELSFAPLGFPAGTAYRVAVRDRFPDGAWRLAPPPDANGTPDSPSFEVDVQVPGAEMPSSGTVQMAVLVFLVPPGPLPAQVPTLGESGADFAFVTAPLTAIP